MVVVVVDGTYLTHENIHGFADILRRHVIGRRFNIYRGEILNDTPNLIDTYEDADLVDISVVQLETGPMQVRVVTDQVTLTFTSYDPTELSAAVGADEGFSWTTFMQHQDHFTQTFWTETRRREQGELVRGYVSFVVAKSHMPSIF